jgi:hypothetical protein
MNGWVGGAFALARIAVLGYAGYVLLLFALQRTVVFPGTRRAPPRAATDSVPPGVTPLWLETPSGRVEAWLLEADVPAPAGARGTTPSDEARDRPISARAPAIIFAHGNGELIDDWPAPMQALRRAGVHVLLVEFPGYGHSDGRPSRATLRETFAAAFDRLAEQPGVDPARIVAMGRSLGAGAATDLALDRPGRALVLLSTFTSAADMAWKHFRVPPFAVRDRFDNRAALTSYEGPVLLLHGRDDDIIPYTHAERLAGLREDLHVIPLDCAHNDCLAVWPDVVEGVLTFLAAEGILDA